MKLLRWLFIVAVCFIWAGYYEAQAQVSAYTFRTDNTSGLAYSPVSGTQVASGATVEDQFYSDIPIGFTFTFSGVNY